MCMGNGKTEYFLQQNLIRFNFDVIIFKHRAFRMLKDIGTSVFLRVVRYVCSIACIEAGFGEHHSTTEHFVCEIFFPRSSILIRISSFFAHNNQELRNGAQR